MTGQVFLEPLTPEGFAAFGQVIEAGAGPGRPVNLGTAMRFDRLGLLENARPAARPNLAVFRLAPQGLPFPLTLFERHPHSSQAFVPMRGARWLLCVAPEDAAGRPDAARARAFVGGPGRGVNLRRGAWHHPLIALDEPAELAMLAWEDGSGGDCVEHRLADPVLVQDPGGAAAG